MPLPLLVPALITLAPPSLPVEPVLPVQKALALLKEGKVGDALAQLDLATRRDPKDPQPHWIKAQIFAQLSEQETGGAKAWDRGRAEEALEDLLDLPEVDRNLGAGAMSMLRHLHDDERPAPPAPSPEARKAFEAAEAAFGRQDWAEARKQYTEALRLSPSFAQAALYLGDTFFAERRMDEAMPWFRKAAELDPADPTAWRYLADAQLSRGTPREAEDTLLEAIQVFPANRASWRPLANLRASQGHPMHRLAFKPGVAVGWKADGKLALGLPDHPEDPQAPPIWLLLAAGTLDSPDASAQPVPADPPGTISTRFRKDLRLWDLALGAYEASCKAAKAEPRDPTLKQFLAFRKDGQLEAALFLLRYREAYRPDYEAWRKAHPGGARAFLDRYNLRP
jgi:tetratricopeptide (TPR) repeat protein